MILLWISEVPRFHQHTVRLWVGRCAVKLYRNWKKGNGFCWWGRAGGPAPSLCRNWWWGNTELVAV